MVFGIRGRPPRHHPFHKNHHFRGHWNGRNRSVVGVAPAVMSIVVVVILTSAWTTMALDRSTTATAALAWPYSGAARKSTSSSGPRRRRGGYGRWYKRRPRDYPAEGTEVESSPPHTGSRSGPKEALRVSVTPPKHVPHQASMQRLLANEKVMRAQDDHRHDVPHSQRHDCLVMDYCQDLNLPKYGTKDRTYYYWCIALELPMLDHHECVRVPRR